MICWNARTFWNFWRFDVLNLASTEFDLRQCQVSSLVSDPWSFFCANVFLDPNWSISWIFYFVHVVSTFGTSGHGFMASWLRPSEPRTVWSGHVTALCNASVVGCWGSHGFLIAIESWLQMCRAISEKRRNLWKEKCGWEMSDKFTGENIVIQHCILYL